MHEGRATHNSKDGVGTSPGMGEGRTMQEQLSRATQEAKAEDAVADGRGGRGSRAARDGVFCVS
jgi:hypothetical protein